MSVVGRSVRGCPLNTRRRATATSVRPCVDFRRPNSCRPSPRTRPVSIRSCADARSTGTSRWRARTAYQSKTNEASSFDQGLSNYDVADVANLYSNPLELPFTPGELRKLAVPGDRVEGLSAKTCTDTQILSWTQTLEKQRSDGKNGRITSSDVYRSINKNTPGQRCFFR